MPLDQNDFTLADFIGGTDEDGIAKIDPVRSAAAKKGWLTRKNRGAFKSRLEDMAYGGPTGGRERVQHEPRLMPAKGGRMVQINAPLPRSEVRRAEAMRRAKDITGNKTGRELVTASRKRRRNRGY